MERSTKEPNKKRVEDSACAIIRAVFEPEQTRQAPTWGEAKAAVSLRCEAGGVRETSIRRYLSLLNVVRKLYPKTKGPGEITSALAEDFKLRRKQKVRPTTIAENINGLRFLWKKWLIKSCKLLTTNPWVDVDKPKLDKRKPAVVSVVQKQAFETWLGKKYPDGRLPFLVLDLKSYLGCRLFELAALTPDQLKEGRVCFRADVSKGRRSRECRLPADLDTELLKVSGRKHVFERFQEERRQFYATHGLKTVVARMALQFQPVYLAKWLEHSLMAFRKERPDIAYFKLHSLRATAISEVRGEGMAAEKAAIFFGVTPRVMAAHYEAFDEVSIADEVAEARLKQVGRK